MTQYTKLNEIDVQKIAERYGIKQVESFHLLSGGSENSNFLIKAKEGNFVITICEQKSIKEAEELANLLNHLAKNEFSTSKIIPSQNGKAIASWEGKPVMVKKFLEGKILADIPIPLINKIGQELGKLHTIEAPEYLPTSLNYGRERFDEVEKYAADSPFHHWLKEKQHYIEKHLATDLPRALIHSDVFYSNVIIGADEKSVTIMDFEEACNYYRIFDLGMTMVGLCRIDEHLQQAKVKGLLEGYGKETQLTNLEKKSLKASVIYAATAMCFWRHKNFNYTNPTPSMKDHYIALQKVADATSKLPEGFFVL